MEKFWLKHYPPGVPAEVDVTQYRSLVHLLEDGLGRFAARDAYAFMDRRIGFAEIDPPAGSEPGDDLVEQAARRCCDNPFYAFDRPPGTSLICIQGDWSNVVDAKIKGRLATAMGVDSRSPYSPLYARAVGTPKPWGVTALFAEYTGTHAPLELDWTLERGMRTVAGYPRVESEPVAGDQPELATAHVTPPSSLRKRFGSPVAKSIVATNTLPGVRGSAAISSTRWLPRAAPIDPQVCPPSTLFANPSGSPT